jgi:alpha-L-fucosidase
MGQETPSHLGSPWHYANATLDYNTTIDHNITHILYTTVRINNTAPLEKITLSSRQSFINWFAITLRPASANAANASDNKPLLDVQNMRSTTKWMNGNATGSTRVQQVEILLDNLAAQTAETSSWLDGRYSINVTSNDLQTVIPGSVNRLRSNDQVLVKVGVRNKPGVPMGSNTKGVATVIDAQGNIIYQSGEFPLVAGIPEYESTDESLGTHEAPDWVRFSCPH